MFEEVQVEIGKAQEGRVGHADFEAIRFESNVRKLNSLIYRITRAVLSNDIAAEACAYRAWATASRIFKTVEDTRAFRVELGRIAYREALDTPSTVRPSSKALALAPRFEGGPPSPDEYNRWRETHLRLLERGIDGLSNGVREVFVLRAISRVPAQDVAAILRISEVNVRVRLHRARNALPPHIREDLTDVFTQDGARSDRLVQEVVLAHREARKRQLGLT